MKKIFQLFLLTVSVLASSTSCTSYPYTEEDEILGFGPIDDFYVEQQKRFKTEDDLYLNKDLDK